MKHFTLLLFFATLIVSSCSPLRVVRLEPVPAQIDSYEYGNAVAVANLPTAEVKTSFFDSDSEVVIFHVEIKNTGDEAITYDPAEASITTPDGELFSAIDPEVEILELDLGEIHRIRTNRTLAIAGVALAVTGAVVAGTADNGGADAVNGFATVQQQLYTDLTFAVVDAAVLGLTSRGIPLNPEDLPGSEERDFWLQYAMRITTIKPGEVAIGKLAFPRSILEGEHEVALPVAGEVAKFNYLQRVYR